jgi:hypothetical protein
MRTSFVDLAVHVRRARFIISDNQPTNMEVFHFIHSVYQMLFFIPDVSTVPVTNSDYSERKG